jgi:hypothetical protein
MRTTCELGWRWRASQLTRHRRCAMEPLYSELRPVMAGGVLQLLRGHMCCAAPMVL